MMLSKIARSLLTLMIACACAFSIGCRNFFSEFADTESDAARLHAARMKLDAGDYGGAITEIAGMSATAQADRDVKVLKASAYAGRCGLNFLRLIDTIMDNSSEALFVTLMKAFPAADDDRIADCMQAETDLLSIASAAADRTPDENMLLATVSLSKIGAILGTYADTDDDGATDAGYNPCSDADLSEDNAKQIGTGMAIAVASLAAANSDSLGNSVTSINQTCEDLKNGTPSIDICGVTDPSEFDASETAGLKTLVKSGNYPGLGICPAIDPANDPTCFCDPAE